MINSDKEIDHDSVLLMLAWSDIQERLDILLLEFRHLQQNIIYFLREPRLLRYLHNEELFLFSTTGENDNYKTYKNDIFDNDIDFNEILDKVMYSFPYPYEENNKNYGDDFSKIHEDINKNWYGDGEWTLEQQQFYHSLVALQRVKRMIFYDKIFLTRYGSKIFRKNNENTAWSYRSKFYILCRGITDNISNYIEILDDFQSQFTKSQDIGLLDHPRPNIERRREQRLFTATMANKCRDMYREIRSLWLEMEGENPLNDDIPVPLVTHRWKHSFTSRFISFKGVLDERLENGGSIVETSYFMPERTEIRTIVAHEVAHVFLNTVFDDFSPQAISLSEHPIASIVRRLEQCLQIFGYPAFSQLLPGLLRKEIMADLMAAATQGYSYLHAMFLELMGAETGNLLYAGPDNKVDLTIIDQLDGKIKVNSDILRQWYVRLYLVSHWLDMIFPESQTKHRSGEYLGKKLSETIRKHCDHLNDYLDNISSPQEQRASYFRALADRLVQILKASKAKECVSIWWNKRSEPFYKKGTAGTRQLTSWPLPFSPLSHNARNFLGKWLERSCQLLLETDDSDTIFRKFPNEVFRENQFSVEGQQSLFEYIDDSPWHISFILAYLLSNQMYNGNKTVDLFSIIKRFHSLVRIGTQYALEFHANEIESPVVKLEEFRSLFFKNLESVDNLEIRNKLNIKSQEIDGIIEKFDVYLTPTNIKSEQKKSEFYIEIFVKLKEIISIIEEDISGNQVIEELHRNLDFYIKQFNVNDRSNPIKDVIQSLSKNGDQDFPYLNSRVSLAGEEIQDSFSYKINNIGAKYITLLGRYDFFIAYKLNQKATYSIPQFRNSDIPKYRSFFIRWEYGLPVKIDIKKPFSPFKDDQDAQNPIAFISILLRRTSSRFNFIHWLIKQKEKNQNHWQQECYAFLSDGWEDIVLVICGSHSNVPQVFDMQDDIYQHPLVLRTEMNFSTKALDYILTPDGRKNIRIRVMYRLRDDVRMNANDEFVQKFKEATKKPMDEGVFPFWTKLTRTPGRMDFSLRLWGPPEKCCLEESIDHGASNSQAKCSDCCISSQRNEGVEKSLCCFDVVDDSCCNKVRSFKRLQVMLEEQKNVPAEGLVYSSLSKLVSGLRIDRIQTNLGWVVDHSS